MDEGHFFLFVYTRNSPGQCQWMKSCWNKTAEFQSLAGILIGQKTSRLSWRWVEVANVGWPSTQTGDGSPGGGQQGGAGAAAAHYPRAGLPPQQVTVEETGGRPQLHQEEQGEDREQDWETGGWKVWRCDLIPCLICTVLTCHRVGQEEKCRTLLRMIHKQMISHLIQFLEKILGVGIKCSYKKIFPGQNWSIFFNKLCELRGAV